MTASENEPAGRTRMWRFRRVATHYLDPILGPAVRKLPNFGILTHRGRRSGRVYHTPVNVFPRGDVYLFFPTYGSDAHWVQNVLAAGSCSMQTRGRVVELVDPQLITDPELRLMPRPVRFFGRRIGVTQVLRLRVAT